MQTDQITNDLSVNPSSSNASMLDDHPLDDNLTLVTGAAGHIGNVLVRQLLARGARVRALILPGEDQRSLQDLEVEIVEGNILQPSTLTHAMNGIRTVYHLAAMISIMPGKNELMSLVNVHGTQNIIQAAINARVKRLVFTSSIHAIARVPHGVTIDESIPFDPDNPCGEYDRSKAKASLAVLAASKQDLDAVIVCPTGVIGPYDYRRSEIGQVILDCVEGKPGLYVDGAYDFVDVRDVAEGMILASEKGRRGETYILSGEQISIDQLLNDVQEVTGKRLKKRRIPMWLARTIAPLTPSYHRLTRTKPRFTSYSLETLESNSAISHAKAERELGYAPRALKATLADTVEWFRANRHRLMASNVR